MHLTQAGTVREQKLMTVRDGCGNAVEFKGLKAQYLFLAGSQILIQNTLCFHRYTSP